ARSPRGCPARCASSDRPDPRPASHQLMLALSDTLALRLHEVSSWPLASESISAESHAPESVPFEIVNEPMHWKNRTSVLSQTRTMARQESACTVPVSSGLAVSFLASVRSAWSLKLLLPSLPKTSMGE